MIKTYQTDKDSVLMYAQDTTSKPWMGVVVAPPEVPEGNVAVWETDLSPIVDITWGDDGTGKWSIKEDKRKEKLYTSEGEYKIGDDYEGNIYNGIGEIPSWLFKEAPPEPEPTEEELESRARNKRDSLLIELDQIVMNPLRWNSFTEPQKESFGVYRQALLDVPQQEGFPHEIIWPISPEQ